MTLSERVVKYRAINKITQHDLAKKIGISPNTLNCIENCKPVTNYSRAKVEVWLDEHDNKV